MAPKGAGGKVRQGKDPVVGVVEGAEGQHPRRQQPEGPGQRRQRGEPAPPAEPRGQRRRSQHRRRQQEEAGVLPVQVPGGQPQAGGGQPGPQPGAGRGLPQPQQRPRKPGEDQQAEGREDVVPVDPQGVRRPGGGQQRQRRIERQGQAAAAAGGGGGPQRAQRRRRQAGGGAPQPRPGGEVRQVQLVERRQPDREEHRLGEGQVVIRPQPLAGRDGVGRPEHQFVVQRGAAHPGVPLLEGGDPQPQQGQHRHHRPEGAGGEIQFSGRGMMHRVLPLTFVSSRCFRSGISAV